MRLSVKQREAGKPSISRSIESSSIDKRRTLKDLSMSARTKRYIVKVAFYFFAKQENPFRRRWQKVFAKCWAKKRASRDISLLCKATTGLAAGLLQECIHKLELNLNPRIYLQLQPLRRKWFQREREREAGTVPFLPRFLSELTLKVATTAFGRQLSMLSRRILPTA